MKVETLEAWGVDMKKPAFIAGPCSAETEEQMLRTAKEIAVDRRRSVASRVRYCNIY